MNEAPTEVGEAASGPSTGDSPVPAGYAVASSHPKASGTGSYPGPGSGVVDPGASIGRYVVIEEIGRGGMGRVYRALDPDLDREVAIKLLDYVSPNAEVRLHREAQVMARLAHPNVMPVYDFGLANERLFIVMELVSGQTMAQWLAAAYRSWKEVMDVMRAAGEGLGAAHAAGLVHRDFKPSNVMLGNDGRVRVMDFGLATLLGEPLTESESELDATDGLLTGGASGSTVLTKTGAIMGTPAYMAPEQHIGSKAGPQSDQFAFCVALHTALYGRLPFEARSLHAIAAAKLSGEMGKRPADTSVPRWLHRAVRRGLAPDPAQRWPAMESLLAALDYEGHARRRRRSVLAITLSSLVAATGGAVLASSPEAACDDGDLLSEVWGPDRITGLRESFAAIGGPHADETWSRVQSLVDGYTGDWRSQWQEACAATRLRGEQPPEVLDLRMACLARRRGELTAALGVLEEIDAKSISKAVDIATDLPSPLDCADVEALAAALPLPTAAEDMAAVDHVRERLARVLALRRAGRHPEALELSRALVEDARALDYAPALAETLRWYGALEHRVGDGELAETAYREAYELAVAAGHDAVVADTAMALGSLLSRVPERLEDARMWLKHAESALPRLRDPGSRAALLFGHQAELAIASGNWKGAAELFAKGIEVLEDAPEPDLEHLVQLLDNYGPALARIGEMDEAIAVLERSIDLQSERLGEHHPDLAFALANLSQILRATGRYDEAAELLERARPLVVESLGAEHPFMGNLLSMQASLAYDQGRFAEAAELERNAVGLRTRVLGRDHLDVATSEGGLGRALLAQRRNEEAIVHLRRALEIRERLLPPDHPDLPLALSSLAGALTLEESYDEALELYGRAREIREAKLGPDNPRLAWIWAGIGEVYQLRGEPKAAIDPLQRALDLHGKGGAPSHIIGQSQFNLGRAISDAGGDHQHARELVGSAVEALQAAGPPGAEQAEAARRWLAEHS